MPRRDAPQVARLGRRAALALVLPTIALVAAACSTPETPTVKAESVTVTSATSQGLGLSISLLVTNSNDFSLSARKIVGKVTLEGGTELGNVAVPTEVTLPKKATTRVVVPMTVGWGNAIAVALAAANKPTVPFTVTGTANVGGKSLNVDVPFSVSGTLTREQLMQATAGAIPKLF